SRTWLATSASEWIVSAKSVGDPVTNQPKPLAAAIAVLVPIEIVTDVDISRRAAPNQPSAADLSAAEHDPFLAGQSFEAHRPPRMQLAGRNADLGAEAVLEAVGEPGRGVDHHRARIDFAQEAHRVAVMRGND